MPNRAEATIESFAELTARLDHPFADRAAILRSAGIDEAAYRRHRDQWSADLAGAPSPELAQRFSDAYERVVRELAAVHGGERAAPDPRFLNADAQPFCEEAVVVGRETKAEAPPLLGGGPLGAPAVSPAPLPWIPEGVHHITNLQETQPAPDGPPAEELPFQRPMPHALEGTLPVDPW